MSEEILLTENETTNVKIYQNTYLFFQTTIKDFDISKLVLTTSENTEKYFQILYSYSFDLTNYKDFTLIDDFVNPDIDSEVYIAIYFKRNESTDLRKPLTIYQTQNVNSDKYLIQLDSLTYDSVSYDFTDEEVIKFQTEYQLINEFPKWNFYDNRTLSINAWLAQCNAIAEMYGHTSIYFKTEIVESEIVHTFSNNKIRNVINIKKLHILTPNNEFPQDRVIYSDWDQAMQDDFIIHIVKNKFEQAFGENTLPSEKDYLYLPLLNKLFKVTACQPKNSYMGRIGWWEVFLAKYEDDESVLMDDSLKTSMEASTDFDEAISNMDLLDDSLKSAILDEIALFKEDTEITSDTIALETVEEKKLVTQNYTNKLVDSTVYVSLKETEKLREYYDKRLSIVSINPDNNSYPVTMYDNSTVSLHTVAMQYTLSDFNTKNKFSITANTDFQLSYDFVLLSKFAGEFINILGDNTDFLLKFSRLNKLEILNNSTAESNIVDYTFSVNELYNIIIGYTVSLKQFAIKIFMLDNTEKTLVYQNIYIITTDITEYIIKNLQTYGGNFYIGKIEFLINSNKILSDNVNPLLVFKSY
jgi:hypothetical protein